MKSYPISIAGVLLIFLFCNYTQAQSFGTKASAVWITDCNQSAFYNTSGIPADLIGPAGNAFDNTNFGVHRQNSGSLILRGASLTTFKNPASSNVCTPRFFYRIYLQSASPGTFNTMNLPFMEDCSGGLFTSGNTCIAGDQKWQLVVPDGTTTPYAPVNLTSFAPGNYVLEVYYDAAGSNSSTSLCNESVTLDNSGNYYKAFFSIQSPTLSSTNPSSCFGTGGSITIGALIPGITYNLTYSDDGVTVGPSPHTANGFGQIILSGLDKGFYSGFMLEANGCTTDLFTGVILSDPIFVPTFSSIPAFCAGTTAPLLPSMSNNGITGNWNPAVIDNQATRTYTFTPAANQCGIPVTITVNVTPRTIPSFSIGSGLIICAGAGVPSLPNTSTNGITGTWSPAVIDNQNSAVYTFTPTAGLCATTRTFTVTVNPNIPPTFTFGSSLTICAGETVPTLPTTSSNGITGTWNPATVDNQNSNTYTFTPNAGQCAINASFTVTVTPNVTPTFSFGTTSTVCHGTTVPTLPTTSDNGITGTWNPAVVDNQNSATYTFTPTAGQCATTASFSVTVNPNIPPTFSIGTSLTICAGGIVPVLPTTSDNGITGTWNPAIVDNQNSATYTFTPTAGVCATIITYTVTVTPNIVPTFSFGTTLTICAGGTVPTLPTTSSNSITGTWSPAVVDNQNSATYTFTPTAGLCATTTTFTVTVNPNIVSTFSFGTTLTICAGGTVPTLPTTSDNGITGTWNPAIADNQTSATYTFTPTAGQCATPASFSVTVTPNIVPVFSFGTGITICAGGIVPALPGTSDNGITGTWNPAVVDNQNTGIYTFTPTAGLCATTRTFTVAVNPNIVPAFSFGTALTICAGGTVPTLPTTSSNSITGTWSPAVVDNQNSATYTFTPNPGFCATTTTFAVTVSPNIIPAFSFGTSLTICAGGTVPTLPTTSDNGITGTWNPAVVDNQNSATYTFTPTPGLCATTTTFTVTVNPNIVPTFSFGTSLTICAGGTVPALPTTSSNGITGTWTPAIADNQNSATYTFTPTAGLCATNTTFTVTVNPNVVPSFDFGTTLDICAGGTVPVLPATSSNGVTGTWSPAVVDNQNSGVYTFTPGAGQCIIPSTVTYTVTVTPNIIPVFNFGSALSICTGGIVPTLPATSVNGITGTWSPSVASNQTSGTYVFTPTPAPGLCVTNFTFTITVNAIVTPAFSFGTFQSICIGAAVPVLSTTSSNGIAGVWSPAVVDNSINATYTFTPNAGQCATTTTFELEVNVIPTLSSGADTSVYDGATIPQFNFTVSSGANVNWTNSNTSVGLAASGTGNIPSFTATNVTNSPVTATIIATPQIGGCIGAAQQYTVTVLPLNKDVFVPNVFTPNRDGKNDLIYVYGNYITKLDMRIFNQWGQLIATINDKTQGWDGTFKGSAQPVGVYVYVLKAEFSTGKTVTLKGSITLIR